MSWRMNISVIPSSGRGCCNRLISYCCCGRFGGARGTPPPQEVPPPTPMTEEEKERFDDLENLLPCHIYRQEEKDGEEEEGSTYHLYDGFNQQDEAQPQQPLSLRLHPEECSICLMDYEDGDTLTSSHNPKCFHVFHRECIKKWLVSNSECPCCRKGFLEFEDDDENVSNPLTARFAALTTSVQQQMRQVRRGIENRLEPIILRLEQEREATIDPNTNDRRRTNRGDNRQDTRYQSDDDDDERSDDRPTLFQHRMSQIREGMSGRLDNIRVRMMEQATMARQRVDDVGGGENLATATSDGRDRSGNEHVPVNTSVTANSSTNDGQQEMLLSPSTLLTATTTRVLEMGSARWKDVSTRLVLLGESFRGMEEPSSESNARQESPLPAAAEPTSNPTTSSLDGTSY